MIVRTHMIRGRTREQKEAFVAQVTEAVCRVFEVPPDQVRVTLIEIERDGWGIGGLTARALRDRWVGTRAQGQLPGEVHEREGNE